MNRRSQRFESTKILRLGQRMKRQNHHELPVLYLRGFAEPGTSFIWVFRKTGGYAPGFRNDRFNPSRWGLSETAAAQNRYAARRAPNQPFNIGHWEAELQKRENANDKILRKIRRQQTISFSEKASFVSYLTCMHMRVTKRFRAAERLLEGYLQRFDWNAMARRFAEIGRFDLAMDVFQTKEFLNSADGKKLLLLESMLHPLEKCTEAIAAMTWEFVVAPAGERFVTSDTPFMFDEVLGLRTSHFLFPVASDVMIVGIPEATTDLKYRQCSADEVLKLNSLTILLAQKEIYADTNDRWIVDAWQNGIQWDHRGGTILTKPEPDFVL